VQQTVRWAVGEGGMDSFPGRTAQDWAFWTGDVANVEMTQRREGEFKGHEWLGVPTWNWIQHKMAL
jgi:hypothetical protein